MAQKVFLWLCLLLGDDRQTNRDFAEQHLTTINNLFDVRTHLTDFAQKSRDEEIKYRVRRILRVYANVSPSSGEVFPKLENLSTNDPLYQGYWNQYLGEAFALSEKDKVLRQRYLAMVYARRKVEEGENRWVIQKLLDKAIDWEKPTTLPMPKKDK